MLKINEGSESPILEVEEEVSENLGEAAERRHLEGEDEETVKALRESVARHQEPWMKVLPVRAVLLTTYRSLAASRDMKPPHLIALADKLLSFLVNLEQQTTSPSQKDIFFNEYLKILDSVFVRLTSSPLPDDQCKGEFASFVDSLWTTLKKGSIKFEGTTIPERLVNRYPSRLEQVMGPSPDSLETIDENLSLDAVLPLCLGSPANFMKVMGHLHTRFSVASSLDSKSKISFCQQILSTLEERSEDKFFLTFPTPFHPLVLFITTLNKAGLAGPNMSSLISDEIVLLLDSLYFQCESDGIDLPLVSFILLNFSQLPQIFMQKCSSAKSIVYKKTPHLKKAMRNSDINLFQTYLHPV